MRTDKSLVRALRGLWLAGAIALLAALPLWAAGPPSPAESVLLIYSDATPYGISLKDTFKNALLAVSPPAIITEVHVGSADIGIYNQLLAQTGQSSLSNWCQVYDLRFREDMNNQPYTGPNQNDVITFTGANNDTQLFTDYLNANGHLFLQGEHHDFYIRDLNLFAFINAVATTGISPAQAYAGYLDTTSIPTLNTVARGGFPATPNAFNTSWNNLVGGTINVGFPGGLEIAYAGSGHPIGAFFTSSFYSTGANQCNSAYAWMSSDLKTNGRLVVSFESNAYQQPQPGSSPASVAVSWIQNVYQLLSGCYRYSLSKAFNPTQLCVNDSGSFTLCYSNEGSTTLTNVPLWDTMPPCLSYTGASQAPNAVNGSVYSWVIPSLAPAASACITVNFTVSSFACP